MYGGSGISPRAASDVERIAVTEQRHDERVARCRARPDLDDRLARRRRTAPSPGGSLRAGRTSASQSRRVGVARFEEQHLAGPASRPAQPQARRDHPRVVDDDEVAGPQQLGQIADVAVLGRGSYRGRRAAGQRRVARSAPGRSAPGRGRSRGPRGAPAQATVARHERPAASIAVPLGDGKMDVHVWLPASGRGPGADC